MNDTNRKILNDLPLTEVMRGWGYVPRNDSPKGDAAWYICPFHNDHRPSLEIRKTPIKDATDLSFKCWACGVQGFGAIQLAARIMGLPSGRVPASELDRVLNELATRCDVELQPEEGGGKIWADNLRKKVVGWDDFKIEKPNYEDLFGGYDAAYERGSWTEEGLRALGLKVELAARRCKRSDLTEHPEISMYAEVKVGDLLTQYDPDTGEALYRCSFGKDFYRGAQRAEAKTIAQWGEELERTFGVIPIDYFYKKEVKLDGGVFVICIKSTKNYPMFVFPYSWGWKKYEPKAVYGGTKWTWFGVSEDADLYHQWYADSALTDALEGVIPEQDSRHPFQIDKDKDGKVTGKVRFERVVLCSGPRDAIAMYSHSNAHVIWLHSEQAGFDSKGGNVRPNRWLRSLLKQLLSVTAEGGLYICYDEDSTGITASQAIALNNPQVRWLRLPKELTEIENGKSEKHLKDVTDFVTRFQEVEGRMPAEVQHDDPVEWFDNALFDTPTCQFWQWESERKDADGTGRARYKFDLRNTPVFLRARGLVRQVMQQGKVSFSRFFLMGNDNTYTECFPGEKGSNKLVAQARDLMAEWLRAHKEYNDDKGALSRAIYSAKLEQGVLENIEQVSIDEHSYGEDFDYFLFENTAVKVTKDGWEKVPYSRMKWWTNSDAILDGNFSVVPQSWRVVINPYYENELKKHEEILRDAGTPEERSQENMRWDSLSGLWKYQLVMDKPIEEMPMHFRFLYNTCRIFWEKEVGTGQIGPVEKQMQDVYFIAMMHALGSALVRQRSANRQQFIHITDNGTRREDLASGGTGKTAIMELLGLMRKVLKVDGKALEGGNIKLSQELDKVVPGWHNIVCLDELPQGFSPKTLYNYTLSLTSRGMYRESVVLEGDDLPKFVVASNEQLDLSSESTSRRTYQILVSDFYHPRSMDGSRPAHTPADDFYEQYGVKEIARNLPPTLLNEARNFMLGCVQLFFQFPDETIRPPKDARAQLRQALASSKDEQFTRWIAAYLADKRHLAIPIAQSELAISLLDYCGITVGDKTIKAAYNRIRNNLDDFILASVYVCDPPVVWKTPTDRENRFRRTAAWRHQMNADGTIKTDEDGNRLPRELDKKKQYRTYYFYRKGHVPKYFYDEAHIGDPDYVQPAPDIDPEQKDISYE